ncbi:MAG: hypothetical protein ACODAU_10435, partial [Myxococcota bacterium]
MDPNADDLLARLRRNPDDLEALAALRSHHRATGDHEGLAKLLEGWAARCRDRRGASEGLREAAEVVATQLGDRERAVMLLSRALERDPTNAAAASMVEQMLVDSGESQRLVEVLERRATALGAAKTHPAETAALHHRLGQLWEKDLERVDRAVFHYRKAFELDPSLLEAIYAARQIYLSAGNLKAAATLYDLEANAETDVPRKVALLRELAQLRAQELGDLEGAVVALKRALSAAPDDLAVKHELAFALAERASRTAAEEAAEEDRARAAELFFELAQRVPDHALPYCEATLDAVPAHGGAMDMLETLAEQQGRLDVLPARWVGFLAAAPNAPAADRRRERLGHAYIAAGQVEDAIACFEPLLEGGHAKAAETLVGLYRRVGRERDVPRALAMVADALPADQRVPRLHELVEVLRAQGRDDEAVARARQILALDPGDDRALALVEEHLRARKDFQGLRDLLRDTAQAPSLTREQRKARMLAAAQLSEDPLDDPQAALDAWREVVHLDRTDRDAQAARLRLLEGQARWDDVAWALGSWLEVETEPDTRAELLQKLADTHRARRRDPYAAIDALRSLRELRPEDDAARNGLCDLLLEVDRALDAIPVLRECVAKAGTADERTRLLRKLATVLEERASDDQGATEAWERLLELQPEDTEALARLEAIHVRSQRFDRLVDTLSRQVEVAAPQERPALLVRMAKLADERLADLDRAADFYEQALELAPEDDAVAEALAEVLWRGARWHDLVQLLRRRADRSEDAAARAALHRRMARVLHGQVGDADAAAESWREVLEAGEDEEALRALVSHARERGDAEELVRWLARLAEVAAGADETRALLMERAALLADALGRAEEAAEVLRRVVSEVAPGDVEALVKLAAACEAAGDDRGLADALERHLRQAEGAAERVPLASRLARLYDEALHDRDAAIDAYTAWAEADPRDDAPRRRLGELLEEAERWEELVRVLDERATLETDEDIVGELLRRAAEVAVHQLGQVEGAWQRLAPRAEAGDALAEDALRELALATGRAEPLAELIVGLAKAAEHDPEEQRRRWTDASKIFEEHVEDAQRALEAMLRAFATDLTDEQMLAEVDRLAAAAGAWLRLAQVYETLVRKQEAPEDKRRLLLRHADLLEEHADDASAALDRVLRAAVLDPGDEAVLKRAEDLAQRVGRTEELLVLYERRQALAGEPTAVVEILLRAVRLCEHDLQDGERAGQYLTQAVHTGIEDDAVLDFLEEEVRGLDEAGGDTLRRRLIAAYETVAAGRGTPGAPLLQRGARLLGDDLGDEEAAYRMLAQATRLAPGNAALLDAFEDLARARDQVAELDRHLDRLADEAIDSATAATLLDRRGRLLEELGRHADAAEVYRQLLPIAPAGSDVSERLRTCLRQSRAFQDLLLVLDRELGKTRDPERRAELLKEVARTWDHDLENRWEALDAWKKVLAAAPGDAEAEEAIERLKQRTRLSDDERLFTDEEDDPETETEPADDIPAREASPRPSEARSRGELEGVPLEEGGRGGRVDEKEPESDPAAEHPSERSEPESENEPTASPEALQRRPAGREPATPQRSEDARREESRAAGSERAERARGGPRRGRGRETERDPSPSEARALTDEEGGRGGRVDEINSEENTMMIDDIGELDVL